MYPYSGTGKTLAAMMTLSRMLTLNPTRPVLFLVDKVLLVLQQARYIITELGSDRQFLRYPWSDQHFFASYQHFSGTPALIFTFYVLRFCVFHTHMMVVIAFSVYARIMWERLTNSFVPALFVFILFKWIAAHMHLFHSLTSLYFALKLVWSTSWVSSRPWFLSKHPLLY